MTEISKNKVVSVVLCNKCERIIGKEKIIFFTDEQIKKEKTNNPKGFCETDDIKNESKYRLILTETCSIC